MIVGIGLDLTEIPRIARLLERWGDRFASKVFTPGERAYADARGNPAQHYAARFAAKEATLKALSVPSGLHWHEMEVVKRDGVRPELSLCGRAARAAATLCIDRVHLTITHATDMACAVVIAEADSCVTS